MGFGIEAIYSAQAVSMHCQVVVLYCEVWMFDLEEVEMRGRSSVDKWANEGGHER